jgi:hypothetical protein
MQGENLLVVCCLGSVAVISCASLHGEFTVFSKSDAPSGCKMRENTSVKEGARTRAQEEKR